MSFPPSEYEMSVNYRLDRINDQIYRLAHFGRYKSELYGKAYPLNSIELLAELPFTAADDISLYGQDMLCVSPREVKRIVTIPTSGTSGISKRIYFTDGDLSRTVSFFAEGMEYICAKGETVAVFMPCDSEYGVGRLLCEGLTRLGAVPKPFGAVNDYPKAADFCRSALPDAAVGIPSQMRRLSMLAPEIGLKRVLLSADYVSEAVCQTLNRYWGSEVFSHYGLTETGYGCAVECPAHMGMHIRSDELYIEIVNPTTGQILPSGHWGEIVITTLLREAMPFIRYRTGDIGRLLPPPCGCGLNVPRLDRVRGRISELSRSPGIYELDELLLSCDAVEDYTASVEDGIYHISVVGDTKSVFNLLSRKYPYLRFEVSSGQGFVSTGTTKRQITYKTSC